MRAITPSSESELLFPLFMAPSAVKQLGDTFKCSLKQLLPGGVVRNKSRILLHSRLREDDRVYIRKILEGKIQLLRQKRQGKFLSRIEKLYTLVK